MSERRRMGKRPPREGNGKKNTCLPTMERISVSIVLLFVNAPTWTLNVPLICTDSIELTNGLPVVYGNAAENSVQVASENFSAAVEIDFPVQRT